MLINLQTFGEFIKDYGPTIGVFGGLIVFFIKYWWNRRHERKVLATAILAEVESIENRYKFSTANGLEPERVFMIERGQGLFEYTVNQDYFNIYKANADRIGLLKVDDVDIIVDFYTSANGYIDTINQWNSAVKTFRELENKVIDIDKVGSQKQFNSLLHLLPRQYLGILNEQNQLLSKIHLVKKLLRRY